MVSQLPALLLIHHMNHSLDLPICAMVLVYLFTSFLALIFSYLADTVPAPVLNI